MILPLEKGETKGFPWGVYLAEAVGTAVLLCLGLSLVILMFGAGSPIARLLPDENVRRPITGFLFGTLGGLIALSPLGTRSGAHLNPVVTIAFRLAGKLEWNVVFFYIMAQLLGGIAGCLPLFAWGEMGRSVAFGATLPGAGFDTTSVFLGEVAATFTMITLLVMFLAVRKIRRFTPAIFAPIYSFLVWAEAPVSGTSTNPARTLGPALISGRWDGWWIYWAGPLLGGVLALAVCSFMVKRIEVAKLYHFDSDRDRLFRRKK
jgi:aquaporin Z